MEKSLPDTLRRYLKKISEYGSLPASESERPKQQLILLLDSSDSMRTDDMTLTRLEISQEASVDLVRERLAGGANSKIAVIGFNDVALVVYPLAAETNLMKLEAAIKSLTAQCRTNMEAGLQAVLQQFQSCKEPASSRELVMLSDGYNTGFDPAPTARQIKDIGVTIFTRGFAGRREAVDEELLRTIASRDHLDQPLYEFHNTRAGLVRDFVKLGGLTK